MWPRDFEEIDQSHIAGQWESQEKTQVFKLKQRLLSTLPLLAPYFVHVAFIKYSRSLWSAGKFPLLSDLCLSQADVAIALTSLCQFLCDSITPYGD